MPFELHLVDLIDIAIVTFILYYILLWLQGTRAISLIRGFVLILAVYVIGRVFGLSTINWLFDRFAAIIAVMLIILFQPELRRMLERFGRGQLINVAMAPHSSYFIRHIVRAVEQMAEQKIGALIVVERLTGLTEYLESGVKLDAVISSELLLSIFNPESPLHDGAVVLQGERILAASTLLPISENRLLDKRLGTRHRAAVGVSELSDALAIVVSEKTGTISIAENGYLTQHLTRDVLEKKLFSLYKSDKAKNNFFHWNRWKK
ncbi:MAG: diadenylate cyclase CdaA [bacterium]